MSHRTFRDSAGVEWQAWEVHPTLAERREVRQRRGKKRTTGERRIREQPRVTVHDNLRHGWLAFRSDAERRRRAPIPPHWNDLSDAQLDDLLCQCERLSDVRRLIE